MDELRNPGGFDIARQTLSEPIFDGLYVMVGPCLDELDRFRIGLGKICRKAVELSNGGDREWQRLSHTRCIAQGLEPFYFQMNTVSNQRKFAEVRPQGGDLGAITSIQRGECGEKR